MTGDLEKYLKTNEFVEGEEIFSFKVKQRLCNVSISNADLFFIVNGFPRDPIELKPFDSIFTRPKIWPWWVKVGFLPMTGNAVNDDKVLS